MRNKKIEGTQKLEETKFNKDSIYNNNKETCSIATSVDISKLSQWINESVIVLDNLLTLKNSSKCKLCKGSMEVNRKIEEVKLLVEELQGTLYKFYLEESVEKTTGYTNYAFNDFYN